MNLFSPKDAAGVLTAYDEPHEFTEPERWAWPSVGAVEDLPVAEITLMPMTSDGDPDRDNVEHFHAYVLPGAHSRGRYVIDQGRMTCDLCGGWLVRLDDGTPLDEVLTSVAGHECPPASPSDADAPAVASE
jgi:hypothetical protein